MAKRSLYSPFKSEWSQEQWNEFCPNFTYRMAGTGEYPNFLPADRTKQFNCAVVMAAA